jgi:phage terminase large subunit-like protein
MGLTNRSLRPSKRRPTNSRASVSRTVANDNFRNVVYDGEEVPDFNKMAVWYCQNVVAGHVPCCIWEKLGCQRFLDMLAASKRLGSEFYYSPDHVTDFCLFFEKLPHVKGFHGTFVAEPVQCWWFAAIFGFRETETGFRWTRAAEIWIPRKNAKTATAVAIALYCSNFEDEPGAECLVSAGSEKQADVPFKAILATIDKEPDLTSHLLIESTKDDIAFRRTGATMSKLAALAPNLDGLNPHFVLAEELHAQKQDVISVLRTAQGARRQALFLTISTAGRSTASAAYSVFKAGQKILEGKQHAPRVFILMYAADEADQKNRFDLGVIEKLNPLWGVSLFKAAMDEEIRNALNSEANLAEYLRTRLNVWSKAAGSLFSVDDWDKCGNRKLSLDLLAGFPMYVGVDLASHSDINAACFMVKVEDTLHMVMRFWIPEESDRFKDDRFADAFMRWAEDKVIIKTAGNHVDHEKILADILDMIEGHTVLGFAFDNWQADYLMGQTEKRGYETFRVSKSPQQLTRSTDDLIARHRSPERLEHDDNPVMSWCVGNVVGFWDTNDNVLPKKESKNSKQSIDGIDAGVLANAARMYHEAGLMEGDGRVKKANPNIYLKRGLAGAAA